MSRYEVIGQAGGSGGGGGSGDVVGPASSTDGDIVLFDGATGKLLKDSGIASVDVAVGLGILSIFSTIPASNLLISNSGQIADSGFGITASRENYFLSMDASNQIVDSGWDAAGLIAYAVSAATSACWKTDGSNTGSGLILGNVEEAASFTIRTADSNTSGGDISIYLGNVISTFDAYSGGSFSIAGGNGWTGGAGVVTYGAALSIAGGNATTSGNAYLAAGGAGLAPGGATLTLVGSDPLNSYGGGWTLESGQASNTNKASIVCGPINDGSGGAITITPGPGSNVVIHNTSGSELAMDGAEISMYAGIGINFWDSTTTSHVKISAPSTVNTVYTLALPTDPPTDSSILAANATGQLLFDTVLRALDGSVSIDYQGRGLSDGSENRLLWAGDGVFITGQRVLAFLDSGTNYAGFKAPTSVGTTYVLQLPTDQSRGVMTNDDSGQLSFKYYDTSGSAAYNVGSGLLDIVYSDSTFLGGDGSAVYTIDDMCAALKRIGALSLGG